LYVSCIPPNHILNETISGYDGKESGSVLVDAKREQGVEEDIFFIE
jgi:hypothetical protein